MRRSNSGKYIETHFGDEVVNAFVPTPLPPDPPIVFCSKLVTQLERAGHALGRLDSIAQLLPEVHFFIYGYVRREAVLSSQIEGTQSSLSDLLKFELAAFQSAPTDDLTEVVNYVSAFEYGNRRLNEGFPISGRFIREVHERLLVQGRGSDKNPGEFRISQNWIGGSRPGNAHFVPPPPSKVGECISDLERFIHDEQSDYSPLISAGMAHAQFETIHPFLDGNGRTGRLLISFMLQSSGLLRLPLLYLSLYFKQNRSAYYHFLDGIRSHGEWENWLEFYLRGVELTSKEAAEKIERVLGLVKQDRERIFGLRRGSAAAKRVFESVIERPIFTVKDAQLRSGLSHPAALGALNILVENGIITETTGRSRSRIFAYQPYLNLLSEDTEPL